MSSSVSPCQWRYRGSGSSEPKGLTVSRVAALLRGWKSCNVDSFRTPPPAAPPLSALSRGRGGHCYASATLPQKTRLSANTQNIAALQPHTQTSQRVCQLHRHLNSQPSTICCYRNVSKQGRQAGRRRRKANRDVRTKRTSLPCIRKESE